MRAENELLKAGLAITHDKIRIFRSYKNAVMPSA